MKNISSLSKGVMFFTLLLFITVIGACGTNSTEQVLEVQPTPLHKMSISIDGSGGGTVVLTYSSDNKNCSADCSIVVEENTKVVIIVTPNLGSVLSGDNCGGDAIVKSKMSCNVTFDLTNLTPTPTVTPDNHPPTPILKHTLSILVVGFGNITSSPVGINCGTNCSVVLNNNISVTLTTIPSQGSTFVGWSDNCPNGMFVMRSSKSCTATFDLTPEPKPMKWVLTKDNPSDDLRLEQLEVGFDGRVHVSGRVNDYKWGNTSGGIFVASFRDGITEWSNGLKTIQNPTPGDFLVSRWVGRDILDGMVLREGKIFFAHENGIVTRIDVSGNVGTFDWKINSPSACSPGSALGKGLAVDNSNVWYASNNCLFLIDIASETFIGYLLPAPTLTKEGFVSAISIDSAGNPVIGMTTYSDNNGTSGYFGGSDGAIRTYYESSPFESSTQFGTANDENVQDICHTAGSLFVLSGGDTRKLRKFDENHNLLGSPVDLSASHADAPMAMDCDDTHAYVKSLDSLEKFDVTNMASTWGGSIATTPTTAPAGSPLDIEVSGGTIFVVESTDEILRFSTSDGSRIQN